MKSVILTCVFGVFLFGTWQVMDAKHKLLNAKLHLMEERHNSLKDRHDALEDRHDALVKAVCGDDCGGRYYYVTLTNGIIRAIEKTPSELPPLTLRELSEARRLMCRYTTFYADNFLKRQER